MNQYSSGFLYIIFGPMGSEKTKGSQSLLNVYSNKKFKGNYNITKIKLERFKWNFKNS